MARRRRRIVWCRHCELVEAEPGRDGLCAADYQYRRRHGGRMRPPELLERQARRNERHSSDL